MKAWTPDGQPRAEHAVAPGHMDKDLAQHRASLAGLDRTQLPADSFSELQFASYAKHRVWTYTLAEQSNVNDTGVASDESWRAFTGANSIVGWMLLGQVTLTGHKGGNILCHWAGNTLCSQFFAYTENQTGNRNPCHIGLKIVVGGQTIVERIGPHAPHDTFQVCGSAFLPAGDPVASLYWSVTPSGPDDATEDVTTGANLLRAHLYASKFLAIGRFR